MKTIPAGSGEKMQYLVHDFNDNTIRFVLAYPGLADEQTLCHAMRDVVMGSDVLHASFDPGAVRSVWHVHETLADGDFFQTVRTTGDPAQEALRWALRPVKPQCKCQLYCTLVLGKKTSAMALCISHLCVDGSDARYLLFKLTEAYREGSVSIKKGRRDPEQLYSRLSKRELRTLMRSPATGIQSPFPFPTPEPGEKRMAHVIIPADVMERAHRRAKALGATTNDLLIAACYAAYAAMPEVDAQAPMSVMSMMDLRRHCPSGDSEGLSNLSGTLPTAFPDGMPADFHALVTEIARQTKREKDNPQAGLTGLPLIHRAARTLPMPLLIKAAGRVYGSVGIGLTNLGNIDCSSLALDGLIPTAGWFGGPLKKKPHMQVSAASFDGACTLTVVGQYTRQDEEHIQAFLARMQNAIAAFA